MSVEVKRGARTRARKLYPTSTSFQGAYVKGALAAAAGSTSRACPYRDDATWRKAYRTAWLRGHRSVAADDPSYYG